MTEPATIAVAMSGGVDSSTVAAILAAQRRHRRRPHSPALGPDPPRRQARHPRRPQGRPLLFSRRRLRRAPRGRASRHSLLRRQPARALRSRMSFAPSSASTSPAARPFPARSATTISSSTSCSRPRAASAPTASPPATTRVNEYDEARDRWILKRPADLAKDQTYFLFGLTQEQLSRTLFPLGHMHQAGGPRSRSPARPRPGRKARLAGDLLHPRRRLQAVPHRISRRAGPAHARHRRRTRHLQPAKSSAATKASPTSPSASARASASPRPSPLYVLQIHPDSHRVTVGADADLATRTLRANRLNWISIPALTAPMRVKIKIRHRHEPGLGHARARRNR